MATAFKTIGNEGAFAAGAFPDESLDDKQAGHLRRFLDLAERLPDDWSGMQGRSYMQEDFAALRFQLAYMSYALALTHVHRLPAAPTLFRRAFEQLIEKMLSPDVWAYWHYVSTAGGPGNRSLGRLPAEWNPVGRDNIMYSAYIQSMALLYQYLFRDDRYTKPGALTFKVRALFWGDGGESFSYDSNSLNDHLYWMMVEKGYLGIACEPNCVFQICNQPAIFGFRMHDLIYGGKTAEEVTEGYKQAWSEFGMVDDQGHFTIVALEKEHILFERPGVAQFDFWLGALMHAWNPEFVEEHYPGQISRWAQPGPNDTLWIAPYASIAAPDMVSALDHGWAAVCASEVGDLDTMEKLLRYSDTCQTPVWEDGAFYYRRCDTASDEAGRLAVMDPHTGNVLLAYARLNVRDGLRRLYDDPLDDAHFAQPALVDMTDGIDLRAARYYADDAMLRLAGARGRARAGPLTFALSNIWGRGSWELSINGQASCAGDAAEVAQSDNARVYREDDHLVVTFDPQDKFEISVQWKW